MSANQSPDLYKEQRWNEGKFSCEICGGEFPTSHRRLQSGLRVGVMCCYEPEGGELERDQRRAAASRIGAALSAKEAKQTYFMGEMFYGVEEVTPFPSFLRSSTPYPVVLTRGGTPVLVVLDGENFSLTDVFAYGAAGITDSVPPVNVSLNEWDLNVQASNAMSAGLYPFTFNGTTWTEFFDVR